MQLKPIKLIVPYLFIQGRNIKWEAILGGDNSPFRDSRVNKLISNSPWRGCNNNIVNGRCTCNSGLSRRWDTYSICQLHRSSHCAMCTIFVSGSSFCHREMKFCRCSRRRALSKRSLMAWGFEWNWNVSCVLFGVWWSFVCFFLKFELWKIIYI